MRLERQQESPRERWPDAVAYREAIQNPALALGHERLARSQVRLSQMGLPAAWSGRFAIVFRLTDACGDDWALRCFTTPGDTLRASRYRLLARHLAMQPESFVAFRYIERGILAGGNWRPVVAMRWADGTPLGRWIEENRRRPERLRALAASLGTLLTTLEAAGIAHGDWQHDNLIVAETGAHVTLVDYDGVFVPELAGYPSPELGHPNYQHPARTQTHFGVGLDRFACLALQTALLALAREPGLWDRYADDESILFTRADFVAPERSPLVAELRALADRFRDEPFADALARLVDACRHGADSTLLPAPATVAPQPLPEIVEPAPPIVPTQNDKINGWWLEPEEITAIPYTAFRHLAKLQTSDCQKANKKHRAVMRTGSAGSLALFGLCLSAGPQDPWLAGILLFGFSQVVAHAYTFWTPYHVLASLKHEIASHQDQIDKKRALLRQQRHAASDPQTRFAGRVPMFDFLRDRLSAVPIHRALALTGMNERAYDALKAAGIENLYQLSQQTASVPGVPTLQRIVLEHWVAAERMWVLDEYRRKFGPPPATPTPPDTAAMEAEIAQIEREMEILQEERRRFPDTSFAAYLRFLLKGMP